MKVEIQIRTLLQHAWAAIEHKLQYKNNQETSPDVKRRFFRMAALLEVADDEFANLRQSIERDQREYQEELTERHLSQHFGESVLSEYLLKSPYLRRLVGISSDGIDVKFTEYRSVSVLMDAFDVLGVHGVYKIDKKLKDLTSTEPSATSPKQFARMLKRQLSMNIASFVRLILFLNTNSAEFNRLYSAHPFGGLQSEIEAYRSSK